MHMLFLFDALDQFVGKCRWLSTFYGIITSKVLKSSSLFIATAGHRGSIMPPQEAPLRSPPIPVSSHSLSTISRASERTGTIAACVVDSEPNRVCFHLPSATMQSTDPAVQAVQQQYSRRLATLKPGTVIFTANPTKIHRCQP